MSILKLNIAVFNKNSDTGILPAIFKENRQANTVIVQNQPLTSLSEQVIRMIKYDLALFQAVGFAQNTAKWADELQLFLNSKDLKQISIYDWLHGAFYIIQGEFAEIDKKTLQTLHQAGISVQILLDLPELQAENAIHFLNQAFPDYEICRYNSCSYELLLNKLLTKFNQSLKSKIVFSITGVILNFLTELRREITDAFEDIDLNLLTLIKNKESIEDKLKSSITCFERIESLGILKDKFIFYLNDFEQAFQIKIDPSIVPELRQFLDDTKKIIDSINIDVFTNDIEAKFKGDFGDNLLAVWKMLKFALNIKDGLINLFDEHFFEPLKQLTEQFRQNHQNSLLVK